MQFTTDDIKDVLKQKGLKVTPQRVSVLQAIYTLNNHPTAEQISEFVRQQCPSIAVGTIYKTLDTFVKQGVIERVKTENEAMRYDGVLQKHHHLHDVNSNEIKDYVNPELDELLKNYFEKNAVEGYEIESIKIHINGKLTD